MADISKNRNFQPSFEGILWPFVERYGFDISDGVKHKYDKQFEKVFLTSKSHQVGLLNEKSSKIAIFAQILLDFKVLSNSFR